MKNKEQELFRKARVINETINIIKENTVKLTEIEWQVINALRDLQTKLQDEAIGNIELDAEKIMSETARKHGFSCENKLATGQY